MDLSFLPSEISCSLSFIDLSLLYEIRLRTNYEIKINYANKEAYLTSFGYSFNKSDAIKCKKEYVDNIINKVTENSIYAFNDRIKEGYITTKDGIRIGLAGECVFDGGKIVTIKNFTSLNIRIPHFITGCSDDLFGYLLDGQVVNNSLIISPPFLGKTTLLKDIIFSLNKLNLGSVLVIDERGEFSEVEGENIDKIAYSNKNYAFNFALRAMSPSIIVCDELNCKEDWFFALNAVSAGVKIIATTHSDCLDSLLKKEFFVNKLFNRYIFLKQTDFGKVESVFDEDYNKL